MIGLYVSMLSGLCQFEVFDQFLLLGPSSLLTVVSLGFTCEVLQDKVDLAHNFLCRNKTLSLSLTA